MKKLWICAALLCILVPGAALSSADTAVVETCGPFSKTADGVVRDARNDLEWYAGPDESMDWQAANAWVSGLRAAGGGWRMPTLRELRTLKRPGVANITPLLKNTGFWAWSGDTEKAAVKWVYNFSYGGEGWNGMPPEDGGRCFAVRSSGEQDE